MKTSLKPKGSKAKGQSHHKAFHSLCSSHLMAQRAPNSAFSERLRLTTDFYMCFEVPDFGLTTPGTVPAHPDCPTTVALVWEQLPSAPPHATEHAHSHQHHRHQAHGSMHKAGGSTITNLTPCQTPPSSALEGEAPFPGTSERRRKGNLLHLQAINPPHLPEPSTDGNRCAAEFPQGPSSVDDGEIPI